MGVYRFFALRFGPSLAWMGEVGSMGSVLDVSGCFPGFDWLHCETDGLYPFCFSQNTI
jgi:hypothetical protein